MKRIYDIMRLVCLAAAFVFVACTDAEDEPETVKEGTVVYPTLKINVCEMEMKAESRASSPMSPDVEKYIRTIALFEFDNEGLHEKGSATYHFIDFIKGTVDGVADVGQVHETEFGIVETTLEGMSFLAHSNGTLCFVANVTEDEVDTFYKNISKTTGQSYGNITLDEFKTWALPFTYVESTSDVYDETTAGHITNMYMFGYYQGAIDTAMGGIKVDIGRLASRIDITIVNETGAAIEKRLGYHFDNVCSSAYFFPLTSGMPPKIGAGIVRTVICAGKGDPVEGDPDFQVVPETFPVDEAHTRYYYAAAHSAADYSEATKLHLFYDRRIVGDDTSDSSNSVWVPLCNVHPSQAAEVPNGYSLSRNTCYHFTIHLRSKATAAPGKASASRATVEYTDLPGDIIVYLP